MITKKKIDSLKIECIEMCSIAGAGHITSAFSCMDIIASLYYDVLRIDPRDPLSPNRDRFILSKNHASLALFPILADLGFYEKKELMTFLNCGSSFGMHAKEGVNGVDFEGGSLGIGLGYACGIALAAQLQKKSFLTFCMIGDAECYEGSIWESVIFAGAKSLNNLIVIVDRNQLGITDFTEKMLPFNDLATKFKAFGWDTVVIDGHSLVEIENTFKTVRNHRNKPLCVIANTVKGNGVDFLENKPLWHGRAPKGDDAECAIRILGGDANGC